LPSFIRSWLVFFRIFILARSRFLHTLQKLVWRRKNLMHKVFSYIKESQLRQESSSGGVGGPGVGVGVGGTEVVLENENFVLYIYDDGWLAAKRG
jgi:hypothetical protein